MDFSELPTIVVNLLLAILILLVGWLIAAVVAGVVKRILRRVHLDERIAGATESADGEGLNVTSWIGSAVFWLILLMAIMGALTAAGLDSVVKPLNVLITQIVQFLPLLLYALILCVIAHIVGSVVRRIITGAAHAAKMDERLNEGTAEGEGMSIASPMGDAAYYLVWLFFLPGILGVLGLESMLVPVQNMINEFMSFLPYLATAAVVLVVGWFAAKILRRIVTGLLASAGVDDFAERVGIAKYMGGTKVSGLLGLLVFIAVLVPVVTAALDALNLTSLTEPLTNMLNDILAAVPNWLAAAAVLVITYVVARWLLGVAVEIMSGVGLNSVPRVLGLSDQEEIGGRTLAKWVGDLGLLIIMLLAIVQAAQIVGWTAVTVAVSRLGSQIVQVVIGLVIIAIGVYLGNMAAQFVQGSKVPNRALLAAAARLAIIAFAGAMGLTTMGLAEQIVVITFALFFGAIAVAVALAFGLGGRETAASEIARWTAQLKEEGPEPPPTRPASLPAPPPPDFQT